MEGVANRAVSQVIFVEQLRQQAVANDMAIEDYSGRLTITANPANAFNDSPIEPAHAALSSEK